MVQVLPAVPNFGSQLAQVLSQVGTDVAKGLQKRQAGKKFEALWQQIQNPSGQPQSGQQNPDQLQASQVQPGQMPQQQTQQGLQNISPLQMVQLSKAASDYMGPEASKVLTNELSQAVQAQRKEQAQFSKEQRQEQRKIAQEKRVEEKKIKEQNEATQELQKIFDKQVGYLESGALGWSAGPFKSRENEQIRSAFNALKPKFVNIARKLENQGHITEFMFKQIEESVANASDSDRKIAGKLEGMADILGLDASKLYDIPWVGKKGQEISGKAKVKMISPNGIEVEVEQDRVEDALQNGGRMK